MSYVLLILERTDRRTGRSEGQGPDEWARMVRFGEDLTKRGILKASESLRPDHDGVRLEIRGGQRTLVDGPFAESKEFVGGFFLLDVATKEEAIAIASTCPAAEWATIEVRKTGACIED